MPKIGDTVPADVVMQDALLRLAARYARPARVRTAPKRPDNNGYGKELSANVDWRKQESLHHNIGTANDQFVGQVRGRAIPLAGKTSAQKANRK